jgi:NADH-quinone oxidoreductase subunit H
MSPLEYHITNALAILVCLVGVSAALIYVERRLLGLWQERYGPNRVGPFGIFQVVADMIKILTKEDWTPPFADKATFVIAPMIILAATLGAFAIVPITPLIGVVHFNIGLLFFFAMTALSVYGIMLAGWSSNSKYSLLGGLRAAAQMISYEVFMALSLMGVVMLSGSWDVRDIVDAQAGGLWFCGPQFLGLVVFVVAGIAETHRLPFDLPEGENELIAGYHTEYSGMKFGMFYVAEYASVVLISAMITVLFFGGWNGPLLPPILWFLIKTGAWITFFVLMRAGLPRPRFDQLMAYGWKLMLPLSLFNLVATGGVALAIIGPK